MVFLGFGKYARADKIYAIEPIRDERRGHGRRTLVWVEGVSEPIVASRTERTILADMGQDAGAREADSSTKRSTSRSASSEQSQSGRVDLADLGRRARHLLEATASPDDPTSSSSQLEPSEIRRAGARPPAGDRPRPAPAAIRPSGGCSSARRSRRFGSEIAAVAAPFQLYQLTHSTLQVGPASLCELFPLLTLTIVGGALADAIDKRKLLLVTEVAAGLRRARLRSSTRRSTSRACGRSTCSSRSRCRSSRSASLG